MQKENKKNNLISVIIPAYKQEKTIHRDLLRIIAVMDRLRYKYEIILVVDGMGDNTWKNAKKIKSPKLLVVGYESNKGKGYAVRFGMARARGGIIAFIDSGMDLHPNGLSMLLEHFEWYNADIIVGSKLHPASKVKYPLMRKLLSWGYRTLVRILFGLQVRDTQVGMKFYKKKVLDDVLPRLLVKTYAFDIEILAVAHHLGYTRIYEAPIDLDFKGASSVASKGFWRTIILMLWDTLAVFYRLRILRYYNKGNKRKWRYDAELNYRVNIS
jgi:glycosyltransferase involved in cell wall biosynthesis